MDEIIGQYWQLSWIFFNEEKAICNQYVSFPKTLITGKYRNVMITNTVYPKKYAHGFCFAVLCCGYTLTDFPISNRLTSLALWQSNDCPSASKATLMNMDKYFMWIHYERLHNHNKAKQNKTVCIFLGIYCSWVLDIPISAAFVSFSSAEALYDQSFNFNTIFFNIKVNIRVKTCLAAMFIVKLGDWNSQVYNANTFCSDKGQPC